MIDIRTAGEMILFRFSLSIYMYLSFNNINYNIIEVTHAY